MQLAFSSSVTAYRTGKRRCTEERLANRTQTHKYERKKLAMSDKPKRHQHNYCQKVSKDLNKRLHPRRTLRIAIPTQSSGKKGSPRHQTLNRSSAHKKQRKTPKKTTTMHFYRTPNNRRGKKIKQNRSKTRRFPIRQTDTPTM
jgi:hypothetical protein